MANEPTIKGTTVQIGFPAGEIITGTIRDSLDNDTTADIEYIRDESNNESTAIISNLGLRKTIEFTAQSAVPSIKKGDVLAVNSISYIVESAVIRYSRLATRGTIVVYKPDAATFAS